MDGDRVADIVKGKQDFSGATVETIFCKVSGIYAVYATDERVVIQYADDPQHGAEQRRALAELNPVRGQINGLMDGWRSARRFNAEKRKSLLRRYDRRTADALSVALQGDQQHAAELLEAIRTEILEERTSIGRIEYLITASIAALVVLILFIWLAPPGGGLLFTGERFDKFTMQHQLWLASGVGALGALFSIALNISGRAVKTDLQRRDNITDAILRIMIGAVSAIVLFALIKSNLVTLAINGDPLNFSSEPKPGAASDAKTYVAIIVAFLAGFSERLVGDFLGSAVLSIKQTSSVAAKEDPDATKNRNENNPAGKASPAVAATRAAAAEGDAARHDHDVDHCACGLELTPDEITDDKELPEATGGVARAS